MKNRKFLALFLALAMVLALAVPAFAEDAVIAPAPTMAGKTVILHSNDVHGAVIGYAYMAALKTQYEAQGAEVILVDAGDYSQGTTYVSSTKGADAVAMMNAAGYDVVTLGNHEFDYGYAQLAENMKQAKFKVLCADVFDANGKTIFDGNTTYTTKSGVKLGFFGMETPETQTKANPALIKGLKFATDEAFYAAAKTQVAALKDADLVICLAHLGVDAESKPYRSYDLYSKVEGIDFIIDGHSHTVMTKGENGESIQSTGTAFANVGLIVIDYLQLMTTGQRTENRVQEISSITRNLKIMAKEMNVPIIALSQLSRAVEKQGNNSSHRPQLSDLRDSGSIEQDADCVLFLYRDSYYASQNPDGAEVDADTAECIVAKNRHGETSTVPLGWDGAHTRFMDVDFKR